MGTDWENILGTKGDNLADSYDEQASMWLYEDHLAAAPSANFANLNDDLLFPLKEI